MEFAVVSLQRDRNNYGIVNYNNGSIVTMELHLETRLPDEWIIIKDKA